MRAATAAARARAAATARARAAAEPAPAAPARKGPPMRAFFCDPLHISAPPRGARWNPHKKNSSARVKKEALMGLIRSVFVMGISLGLAVAAQARDSESRTAASIAQRFAALAGGKRENAMALTLALRNGDRVTLVDDDGGSRVPATKVFELPARE